ncbi:MAG: D-alanyl-D-alanine carboxypeptidase [Clostridia bacterium]|nr:D-alanyl-D-alanine carboxypeptidase [Clostridia bacterium]
MKKIFICVLTAVMCAASALTVYSAESALPQVSARSAVLIEADSGEVVLEKDADMMLPMASTTKIMTALVAIELLPDDRIVEIHQDAVGVEGSSVYLKAGEKLSFSDLLNSLMLASANDAAAAIAYECAGGIDEFAALMNEKARELGLESTHFTNPHGLDHEEHYTTARDLALLTRYAMQNERFAKVVSTLTHQLERDAENGTCFVVNHNKLLRTYDGAIGVKTGFTKRAGRCLVSAAERDGVRLIAVTLDAPSDWNDHKRMLDYGFSLYERVTVAELGRISVNLPCIGGDKSTVKCSNAEAVSCVLKRGEKTVVQIEADRYFPAPVKKGDALACAVIYADGAEVARVPLLAEADVNIDDTELSVIERILQFLGR